MAASSDSTLKKTLTLFDVYAISTGAMFSSGFFLLPGLATAISGPSAILAYLLAGVLIMPAMFSQAELSSAMPRAGGTYYFLDRSLGPLAGTVGGLGTWLALVFKSAFALIGMGAYLALFFDVPIKPLAAALTVAFAVLNTVGAKETSSLQRILVAVLVAVLTYFVVAGLVEVVSLESGSHQEQLTPFLPFGIDGLFATVGFVFVSYAGLTKVTSVAEEVKNPDRNIPLGMFLSLATATAIYVVGTYIMVMVLDPSELREDLTPVATAGEVFLDWLPGEAGLILIVTAAIAAFASTGNAGILSASRYPLAMSRDRLLPDSFSRIGRFGTPTWGIVTTAILMLIIIFTLDEEGVAKLASAFQLVIFGLLNIAVIIMRESGIASYAPGYRSPLYPWMQIAGVIIPAFLISEMGTLSIVLTLALVLVGTGWYFYYASGTVAREGAIFHLFARLGRFRYEELDSELHDILEQKETSGHITFDKLVAEAPLIRLSEPMAYPDIVEHAAETLADRLGLPAERIAHDFLDGTQHSAISVAHGVALPYNRLAGIEKQALVMVHCRSGVCIDFRAVGDDIDGEGSTSDPVYAIFFLVSPYEDQGQHLRILATIASRTDEDAFMTQWRTAETEQELKETLLRHDRYLTLLLLSGSETGDFIGQRVEDVSLPAGTHIAIIQRDGDMVAPRMSERLREGDRLTIIGEPASIQRVYELYSTGEGLIIP